MSGVKHCLICGREMPSASNGRRVYCSYTCQKKAASARVMKRIASDPAARAAHNEAVRRYRAKTFAAQGPDKPLNAPRLCPGGPWNHGKCGHKAAYESRWCEKCQQARRKYYRLGWSTSDPAEGFSGREVEHEVAI